MPENQTFAIFTYPASFGCRPSARSVTSGPAGLRMSTRTSFAPVDWSSAANAVYCSFTVRRQASCDATELTRMVVRITVAPGLCWKMVLIRFVTLAPASGTVPPRLQLFVPASRRMRLGFNCGTCREMRVSMVYQGNKAGKQIRVWQRLLRLCLPTQQSVRLQNRVQPRQHYR